MGTVHLAGDGDKRTACGHYISENMATSDSPTLVLCARCRGTVKFTQAATAASYERDRKRREEQEREAIKARVNAEPGYPTLIPVTRTTQDPALAHLHVRPIEERVQNTLDLLRARQEDMEERERRCRVRWGEARSTIASTLHREEAERYALRANEYRLLIATLRGHH